MQIVAHRGASGTAPENTLAAFKKALQSGADWIELDVHASSDGVPVVIHDKRLERTTNLEGMVKELPLDDLRRASAGAWFTPEFAEERIPTLEEALSLIAPHKPVAVEIKQRGIVPSVMTVARALNASESITIISFEPDDLRAAKAEGAKIGLLLNKPLMPEEAMDKAAELGVDLLSVHFSLASPELTNKAETYGLPIWVWTVDDPQAQTTLARLGVRGLVTNFPERLAELRATWKQEP